MWFRLERLEELFVLGDGVVQPDALSHRDSPGIQPIIDSLGAPNRRSLKPDPFIRHL